MGIDCATLRILADVLQLTGVRKAFACMLDAIAARLRPAA
jgi:hypothetical protein